MDVGEDEDEVGRGGVNPYENPETWIAVNATLDDLASYLYEHVMDDEEFLVAGVGNLETWLAEDNAEEDFDTNLDATAEGYTVTNLTVEAVESLDGVRRETARLAPGVTIVDRDRVVATLSKAHAGASHQVDGGDHLEAHRIEAGTAVSACSAPQRASSPAESHRVPAPG